MPAHILLAAFLATPPAVAPTPKEPAVYATIPVEKDHVTGDAHFSPDGKALAFFEGGVEDGKIVMWIVLWDVAKKERTAEYETKSLYRRMVWSSDGKAIYATDLGSVCRVDVATGKRAILYEHGDTVTALKYLPDTKQLVSAAEDGSIVVWDAAKDKRVKELKCPQDAHAWDAQPVPGTSKLVVLASYATLENDGQKQVYRIRKAVYAADLADGTFATALDRQSVSNDRRQLAASHAGGEYAFANPEKGVVITDATTGKSRTVTDCPVVPLNCRFSPSDRYLFVGGCEKDGARFKQSGAIAVYDLTAEKWVGQWATKGSAVRDLSYSAAGNLLTCTSGDGAERQITIWDMKGIVDPAAKPKKKD